MERGVGGPGERQFELRTGIEWTPRVGYTRVASDAPEGRRRSVYRFLFRTLPDPWMEALDCPAGDQLLPARNNSVTLQQALALWNNAFSLRQAEHWAESLQARGGDSSESWKEVGWWAWGRPLTDTEQQEWTRYARKPGLANSGRLTFKRTTVPCVPLTT